MLNILKTFFSNKGFYYGTHKFIDIDFEGGFEAFSGRATETWEYRWVITIPENKQLHIPYLQVKGRYNESIDSLSERVWTILCQHNDIKPSVDDVVNNHSHDKSV
jgi:hypothetical protein